MDAYNLSYMWIIKAKKTKEQTPPPLQEKKAHRYRLVPTDWWLPDVGDRGCKKWVHCLVFLNLNKLNILKYGWNF